MNTDQRTKELIDYIINKAKPVFVDLIKETTKENNFPVIDRENLLLPKLFESAVEHLKEITSLFVNENFCFNDVYNTCHSLLSRDGTLDKVATICAGIYRITLPFISVKKRVSKLIQEIKYVKDCFVSIIVLAALELLKWPFNETETANVIIATTLDEKVHEALKNYLKIFEFYENAGVNLSYLDNYKIVKELHRTYLFELYRNTTIAFFFYKNEALKSAFSNTLMLKAITDSKFIDNAKFCTKRLKDFTEALKLVAPVKDEKLTEERKKAIKERAKSDIELFTRRCLEERGPVVNWKSAVKEALKLLADYLEVVIDNSVVRFNFDSLKNHFEQLVRTSYTKIIKLMAEEKSEFHSTLADEILLLTTYITVWKTIHEMQEKYRKVSLAEFLDSLDYSVSTFTILDHFCYETASELAEGFRKASKQIDEWFEKMEKSSEDISPEEMISSIREKVTKYELYWEIRELVEKVEKSSYKKLKNNVECLLEKLLSSYIIRFHNVITALVRTSQVIYSVEEKTRANDYIEWFKEKIRDLKEVNINDIYKAIITRETPNTEVIGKLKGFYILLNIADILRQELDYKFEYRLYENKISLASGLEIKDALVVAFIAAKLLKFYEKRGLKTKIDKRLFNIKLKPYGVPVVSSLATLSFDDVESYFSELISTHSTSDNN